MVNAEIDRGSRGMNRTFIVLAALLGIAHLSLALRGSERIWDTPLTDDGYYALTIARNLAAGHGFTYHGHPTNGVQPLWVLVVAPAYLVVGGDRLLALRLVLAMSAALFIATAIILGRLVTRMPGVVAPPMLVTVLFLGSGLLYRQYFNGLETGLYLCVLTVAWWMFVNQTRSTRWVVMFGALLGVVVLARIDAVLLVAFIVGLLGRDALRSRRPWWHVAAVGGVSALVCCPWWIYNVRIFGNVMPTSGLSQFSIDGSWERAGHMVRAISLNAAPGLYVPDRFDVPALTVLRIGLLAACAILARKGWNIAAASSTPGHHSTASARLILWFSLALALVYGICFNSVFFFHRYLAPLSLGSTLAIAAGLSEAAQRWHQARPLLTALPSGSALITIILVVLAHAELGVTTNTSSAYHEQLGLVEDLVPNGARVGAAQSGLLGYFRDDVVNLDGKVNAEALAYRDDVVRYLDMECVEYFVDWPYWTQEYLGLHPRDVGWHLVAERGDFQLWRRVQAPPCGAGKQ